MPIKFKVWKEMERSWADILRGIAGCAFPELNIGSFS